MRALIIGLLLLASPAYGDIIINGLDDEKTRGVRSFISLTDDCSLPRWTVRYRYRNADNEIRQALQSWGYYTPEIEKSLTFGSDCWHAVFDIDPGQPVIIRHLDVELAGDGRDDEALNDVLRNPAIAKGERFDHEVYESFKNLLDQTATGRGYFDATFTTREVIVQPEQHAADVRLVFDTGPRYRFGEVVFENASLTEVLMSRYLTFDMTDYYDAEKISELYQAVLSSGYFEDVTVQTRIDEQNHLVPVTVQLTPVDPDKTRVGIGFSTDIGPKASLSYSNLRLNQHGQRLNTDLSWSPVRKEAGMEYRLPADKHRNGWTSVYAGLLEEDPDTSWSRRYTLGARQLVPRSHGWFESRFIEIIDDRFDVADDEGYNFSVVPGIGWSHSSTSASRRPLRGHTFNAEFSTTSEALGSTINYSSVVLHAKFLHGLWPGGRVITKGRVGATFTDDFDRLQPSVRFFSGGDDRIRGYDFKSVGPVDENGQVIGGNRVVEASVEVDQLVHKNWAVAVFVDAGNATLDRFATELETGAGVGVRWYSPLGPLRLDVAAPVRSEESGVRMHISFGPDI
ncbi:MAG: outer membrane protein assembly factor [Pseudomonadales bacterium]|nr:outer membrane protein assembly factor [Pseudomonadales bacterium]